MAALSLYSIKALAQVVTGGSNSSPAEEAVAPYRTGAKIQQFFAALCINFQLGSFSRVPAVEELLTTFANEPDGLKTLTAVLEQAVDPRHFKNYPDLLGRAVAYLNKNLEYDGWTLKEVNCRHRMVVFNGVPGQHQPRGVEGAPKNLIFASTGPKPEIVLTDAINNDIRIVKNGEFCLIYERPTSALTWDNMVQWWAERTRKDASDPEVPKSLYIRLLQATNSSVPEKVLFETYYRTFKSLGPALPALLPQVYLHYDPRTLKELYGEKRLARQRMDFLLLFSEATRVVIEVDGVQHYAESDRPSPARYAEVVAADRQLRLAGYDVFRFGGDRLADHDPGLRRDAFEQISVRHGSPRSMGCGSILDAAARDEHLLTAARVRGALTPRPPPAPDHLPPTGPPGRLPRAAEGPRQVLPAEGVTSALSCHACAAPRRSRPAARPTP